MDNMKPLLSVLIVFLLGYISSSAQTGQFQAKRAAPKEVLDIRYENLVLQRSGMEYIQALDSATKMVVWKKNIYSITYIPKLETDVQDVFIDSMYLSGPHLIIRNEQKQWFSLDLQTLETKKIKRPA
jgi:hypothetical protein